MNRFANRSTESELIDEAGIPFSDWETCLRELNMVNTYLGGHRITVDGVRQLLKNQQRKEVHICEIGCGGGDNLKAIAHSFDRNGEHIFKFTGVDINEACTVFARDNCKKIDAQFICSDYREVVFDRKPDIIFNSLFCHHFSREQIVAMLSWMSKNTTTGFFINDLQRHPVAYHSIKWLTTIFSRSYLVKNDGPVSVKRGFLKAEWEEMLQQANIKKYSIEWRWAFRYLVIVQHE